MISRRNPILALIAIVACVASDVNAAESTVDDVYVFYLHGRIIEEEGLTPTHPTYGLYDYPAIMTALGSRGAIVVSEVRPSATDVSHYAQKTISDIEKLLDDGIDASQIVVVGFSKGSVISIFVSSRFERPDIRYVIMAGCGSWLDSFPRLKLTGHVFSIFEKSDATAGSCRELSKRSDGPASFRELEISTGKQHGAFYLPRSEWVTPVLDWIHSDEN